MNLRKKKTQTHMYTQRFSVFPHIPTNEKQQEKERYTIWNLISSKSKLSPYHNKNEDEDKERPTPCHCFLNRGWSTHLHPVKAESHGCVKTIRAISGENNTTSSSCGLHKYQTMHAKCSLNFKSSHKQLCICSTYYREKKKHKNSPKRLGTGKHGNSGSILFAARDKRYRCRD